MELLPESLFCSPELRLIVGASARPEIRDSFERGVASGILFLTTNANLEDLPSPLAWAREWGRQFFTRLCQVRTPGLVPPPEAETLQKHLSAAPPFRGAEYLSEALLLRLWNELRSLIENLTGGHPGGVDAWLLESASMWHLVGRVTFHLAENRRNEAQPFAFLATYTDQVSGTGQLQHVPLGRALQTFSDQNAQAALDALLQPVRLAAQKSVFIRGLVESRHLFKALAWTPQDAFQFLQEIPLLEECGLVVKVPDWWKGGRPSRPVVTVQLDAPQAGGVGIDAMLAFNIGVSLNGVPLTEEEKAQIHATASGLVNLRGQWVEVDREQLTKVLNHWTRVQAAHSSGHISFHQGMRWLAGFGSPDGASASEPDLDSGRNWNELIAGKNLQVILDKLRDPEEIRVIPGLKATLRPYQQQGVAWLAFVNRLGLGACLADDMGLGKTLQVIALLCLLRKQSASDTPASILIVPASLMGNWLTELRQFAPHLRVFAGHSALTSQESLEVLIRDPQATLQEFDALLTTYGMLQRNESLQLADWNLAVLDEAQAIKNPATAQARTVKQLKTRSRLALTGTPVENRVGDLWSLFDFLNPGLLGNATAFAEFTKRISASKSGYAPLRQLIRPYLLRRLKTDRRIIQDLPEKIEMQTRCPLTKKQGILYGKLVEQLKSDLANPTLPQNERRGLVLGYLIKFKQVCNHPSQWSGDGRFDPTDSGKFLRLGELVTELAERQERCLVFTQFREMTASIAAHLAQIYGRPGLILHGGTPVKQRPGLVEEFQRPDGPPFFVLSVKAGGTGLTLTAANHVIHFDRWWNPAVENQATDRAFRIGQKRNVLVHKFVCPGTIEEKVDRLLAGKGALAEDLLAGGGAERLLTEMSNKELLDFVRLDIHSA
ncbi:MAG: DEAD/DEAH box helicase [Verrucomicrobiota bacterium]